MKQVKELQLGDEVALRSDVDPKLHQSEAAPVFDATQDYPAGYHVTYNGYLYQFTSAHAAGAWTGNDVVLDNMTSPDAMLDLTSAGFLRVVSADGTILWMQNALSASRSEIAADFSASAAYAPPALVVYNGVLYRCITAHPAGAWDATHFTLATVQDVLALMNTEKANDAYVVHKTDAETIAGLKTFNDGIVVNNDISNANGFVTTKGIVLHDVAQGYIGGDSLDSHLIHIRTYADTALGLPAGDVAIPRANGVVALTADIPYILVTKTVTNGAVTLDDHACDYVDATNLLTLDIEFPVGQEGKMRDFLFAVNCGATPPNISYASYITIMAEDADMLVPEEGMNVYAFTEFKPNMFFASRKLVATVVRNSPENGDQLLLAMQQRGIDTSGITDYGGAATALGLGDSATLQDAVDAVMN